MASDLTFRASVTKRFAVLNSIKDKPVWEIPSSWNSVLYNQVISTNGTSTSQLQFPLTNISSSYLLGNCPIVKAQMTATINWTNNSGGNDSLFENGACAPNAFPLNKSCQSSVVNLGGGQILTATQDFFAVAVTSHADFFKDLTCLSGCVNASDVYGQITANEAGNSKNVLGDYSTSIYGNAGRLAQSYITAYNNTQVANGGTGNATLSWTNYEPIFNGLLSFDPSQETTISGLVSNGSFILMNLVNLSGNALKINLNTLENADPRMVTINSLAVTFDSPPILFYTLYDPYPLSVPTKSYYKCIEYNNRGSSQVVAPAAGVISNATVSIQDTLVNKAIYVWLNPVLASIKNYANSDAPQYQITQLQVQYGNQPSQFTTYDEFALYKYFVAEQGSIKAFNETFWSTSFVANTNAVVGSDTLKSYPLYGSVLRIPSEMLCGYDRTKLGVGSAYLQNLQVQVTATYTGPAEDAPPAQLFIQCVDESLVCIENGTLVDVGTTGLITPDIVQSVMSMTPIIYEEADGVGGGVFSKLGTLARKAAAHYEANKGTYHAIAQKALEHPVVQKGIARVASKVGLGEGRHKMHHRRGRGLAYDSDEDEMCGGSLISSSTIANRLKNL